MMTGPLPDFMLLSDYLDAIAILEATGRTINRIMWVDGAYSEYQYEKMSEYLETVF